MITKRLNIHIASDAEMRELISAQADEALKEVDGETPAGCIAQPERPQWSAAWMEKKAEASKQRGQGG